MAQQVCVYEKEQFSCFDSMTETLLHEINQQIVRIDIGEKENTEEERSYAKWRLIHLQQCFGDCVPERYRSTYNSLWSQLYRLEHQKNYRHPYVSYLIEKIFCQSTSRTG
ncbi:hypothetical protein JQN58_11815 [Aneurinibacillus sp. BA2021]|nr:hypothetical protein [Aneurinibacillus sp. BA2021]